MGEDPLDIASRTGLSCGTVGMETGMMDLVKCPRSAGGISRRSVRLEDHKPTQQYSKNILQQNELCS